MKDIREQQSVYCYNCLSLRGLPQTNDTKTTPPHLPDIYDPGSPEYRHWKPCDAVLNTLLAAKKLQNDLVITCEDKDPNI